MADPLADDPTDGLRTYTIGSAAYVEAAAALASIGTMLAASRDPWEQPPILMKRKVVKPSSKRRAKAKAARKANLRRIARG